jgi:hypothetical protein
MVEDVSAGKVGEAAQSVIILALKEEVADQVHLSAAVSVGPRHGRQQLLAAKWGHRRRVERGRGVGGIDGFLAPSRSAEG